MLDTIADPITTTAAPDAEGPGPGPATTPAAADRYRVFISYRRSDSELAAQQVYERLRRKFGDDRIFIDRQIPAGADWERVLEQRLRNCSVFVLLIGNRFGAEFADRRQQRDAAAAAGRETEPDPLETEVALALELERQHRLRVLPVLVGPQDMPSAPSLPESIQDIRRLNAVWAHPLVFETAMAKLVQAIAATDHQLRVLDDPALTKPGLVERGLGIALAGLLAVAAALLLPLLGYAVFWLAGPAVVAADTSTEARLWYGVQYALATAFGGLAPYLAAWLVAELRVRASLPAFDLQGALTAVAMFGMVYAGALFLVLSSLPGWRLQPLGLAPWFEAGAAPLPQWAMYVLLAGGMLMLVLLAPFLALFEAWHRRNEAANRLADGLRDPRRRRLLLGTASLLLSAAAAWLCASMLSSLRAPDPPPVVPVVGYLLLCPALSLILFSWQLARSYLGVRQRSWPFRLLVSMLVGLYLTATLSLYAQGPFRVLELNAEPGLAAR